MPYSVYILFREDGETPFYVGLTRRRKRVNEHIETAKRRRRKSHKDNVVLKVVSALGFLPHVFAARGLSKEDAVFIERSMIAHYGRFPAGPLLNMTDGGDGAIGYVATDEVRTKISIALKGRTISEEHRQKISAAKMGYVQTYEARRKMSESKKRLGITPAMKEAAARSIGRKNPTSGEKIAAALRGKPKTQEHIAAVQAALSKSPAWAAYNERRRSRKGNNAPQPVEASKNRQNA